MAGLSQILLPEIRKERARLLVLVLEQSQMDPVENIDVIFEHLRVCEIAAFADLYWESSYFVEMTEVS